MKMFSLLKPNMFKEDVFVATDFCFVKELQPKKKTIKSTDIYGRNPISRHYEYRFWYVSKIEYFQLKLFFT